MLDFHSSYFLCTPRGSSIVQKSVLLEPPSVAHGGKGVVVARCPTCKKRINTITDFLDHLTNDVIPELINRRLGR